MTAIAFPAPKPDILARRAFLIDGLSKLVPPASLITSEDERRPYETDAFTAYKRLPMIVVLPETTEQVSAVLKFCGEHGVPVVPRGAGTSLCGARPRRRIPSSSASPSVNRVLDVSYPTARCACRPASPTSLFPPISRLTASSTRRSLVAARPAPSAATSP